MAAAKRAIRFAQAKQGRSDVGRDGKQARGPKKVRSTFDSEIYATEQDYIDRRDAELADAFDYRTDGDDGEGGW